MNSVISLMSVLIITILILYLSYIFTKSIGKGMGLKRGGNYMQMLDRLPLGQDKAIAVVRAGSHYFLIGIASSQITVLAELTEEDIQKSLDIPNPQTGDGYPDFISILKKYTDKNRKDL
ncbi:flagellar protein FliO/FliZ [Lacrimispora xylanisolvens]|uniref:Flagellar protein FliO/FliZ n=1 Tax=Lacrimispora xylanisolvens TaxID=384636 RepID=A0A2S6HMJ5_9FIRM|nr:flagellar biosynthetic protein FliO [Hungatella xylanolytica]PPK78709.1 flagellar protein FliO/FliZ [Hungatella xylanolytica]